MDHRTKKTSAQAPENLYMQEMSRISTLSPEQEVDIFKSIALNEARLAYLMLRYPLALSDHETTGTVSRARKEFLRRLKNKPFYLGQGSRFTGRCVYPKPYGFTNPEASGYARSPGTGHY